MGIAHAKVSAKADGGDATLVMPSDWNADHVFTGVPRLCSADLMIASGAGLIVPADYEIAAGINFEIGANAVLEIT